MLKLNEVKKLYRKKSALNRVNLTIKKGNLYLFIGENGSGKSTTIKLIAKIIFNNKNEGLIINEFDKIVYMADKRSYPPLLKVKTFLSIYLNVKENNSKIDEWLKKYNLENKRIIELSKGMKQKVGIIQTLLTEGDLYLFDEPIDGLDKESIEIFKADLKEMLNFGKTIVISSHNKIIFRELKPITYKFDSGYCNEKK